MYNLSPEAPFSSRPQTSRMAVRPRFSGSGAWGKCSQHCVPLAIVVDALTAEHGLLLGWLVSCCCNCLGLPRLCYSPRLCWTPHIAGTDLLVCLAQPNEFWSRTSSRLTQKSINGGRLLRTQLFTIAPGYV